MKREVTEGVQGMVEMMAEIKQGTKGMEIGVVTEMEKGVETIGM